MKRDSISSIFGKIKSKPNLNYTDEYIFSGFDLHNISYPYKKKDADIVSDYPGKEPIQEAIDSIKKITGNEEYPYLLVSGDLSGIQDTVYTISSKGALKSLRARSFMLEFLCEHLCYELVTNVFKDDYIKYKNHVIFAGGGGFCLLLPNTDKVKETIKKIKTIINDWAFEEFGGKLYAAIEYIELNENERKIDGHNENFMKRWRELSDKLEIDKKRKFNWKLSNIFANIKEPTLRNNTQECQICQRDDIDFAKEPMRNLKGEILHSISKIENAENNLENPIMHELCYQLYKLGDELTEKFYISRNDDKPKEPYIYFPSLNGKDKIENNVYKIYYKLEKSKSDKCLWGINKFEDNIIPFYYANYVTKFEDLNSEVQELERDENPDVKTGDTASFNALANMSCGTALIGCLRMDVDNLGKIFTEFPEFNLITLSHLSKMLNLFFKVFLVKICEGNLGKDETGKDIDPTDLTTKEYKKNGGRNVTIIYSGGDDLFIVGAWDEAAELAYDIQKCFYKFSGLGISAGMTLHKPDFPLYQMARLSGESLLQAKSIILKSKRELEPSKNKFSLFYSGSFKRISNQLNKEAKITGLPDKFIYAVSWDNEITDLVKDLIGLCNKTNGKIELKHISHGFLNRLFNVIEVWWTKDTLYIPELYYIMKKIYKGSEDETAFNKLKNIQDRLIKAPFQKMDHNAIRSLKITLTWFELLLRNKGE